VRESWSLSHPGHSDYKVYKSNGHKILSHFHPPSAILRPRWQENARGDDQWSESGKASRRKKRSS